jgi:hypothetical protein
MAEPQGKEISAACHDLVSCYKKIRAWEFQFIEGALEGRVTPFRKFKLYSIMNPNRIFS